MFLSIVLVNCACVHFGECVGEAFFPPVFELMQFLAYSGEPVLCRR